MSGCLHGYRLKYLQWSIYPRRPLRMRLRQSFERPLWSSSLASHAGGGESEARREIVEDPVIMNTTLSWPKEALLVTRGFSCRKVRNVENSLLAITKHSFCEMSGYDRVARLCQSY